MLEGGAEVEEKHVPESAAAEQNEVCHDEDLIQAEPAEQGEPSEHMDDAEGCQCSAIQKQCAQLERVNAELANQLLRLKADFENYKRRTRGQIEEIKSQASADLIIDLLPVLDDFERAIQSAQQTDKVEALAQGINMVFDKLMHTLGLHGLARINAQGEPFDANLHEAVSVIGEAEGPLHVMNELQAGYTLNGKVIRHTKVQVGELKGD